MSSDEFPVDNRPGSDHHEDAHNDAPPRADDDSAAMDSDTHSNTGCDAVEALIPALSLHAADPEEAAFVQARLAQCPKAAVALSEYAELRQALLHSSPPIEAPAHLADQLRGAIASPSSRRSANPPAGQPVPRARRVPAQPAAQRPWDRLRARVPSRPLSAVQLAVIGAIAALVVLNLFLFERIHTLQETQNTLLRLILSDQTAQQSRALALLAEGDLQSITLPSAQDDGAAQASLLWRPDADVAVLYAQNFPPLPPDSVYQLWLVQNGKRANGGLFTVDEAGRGALVVSLPAPLDTFDVLGITTEPSGGSYGPTTPPVVRVQL